jgi:hypothetical protein
MEARWSPYIIIGSAIFSLLWGLINVFKIKNIKMTPDIIQVGVIYDTELRSPEF